MRLFRYLLGLCAAFLVLVACAGPPPTGASAGLLPARTRPNLAGQNLLYVSGRIYVSLLTYPQGRTIGRFLTPGITSGECADSAGDVFVTDGLSGILIFYRGDLGPPTVLSDPGFYAYGCAIDPTSGDLAVTNSTSVLSQPAGVVIYTSLYEPPTLYKIPKFFTYFYCSYDNIGNLFVDGTDDANPSHVKLAELVNGGNVFSDLRIDRTLTSAGGVQWDGKYVAIGDPDASVLYRLKVNGSRARVVSSTKFNSPSPLGQFWIAQERGPIKKYRGQVFIATECCGGTYARIGYWKYPAGGSPIKTLSGFAGSYGFALSVPSY